MNDHSNSQPIKYVAQISGVREVVLGGTADLAYWQNRLQPEDMRPLDLAGKARVLINATSARFWGVPFRELNLSVVVEDSAGAGESAPFQTGGASTTSANLESREVHAAIPAHKAVFLAHAYNSARFFVFVERRWFGTPYGHARIEVQARRPAVLRLALGSAPALAAKMQQPPNSERPPLCSGRELWQGPVFLPRGARGGSAIGRFFLARLEGFTTTYPFSRGQDELTLNADCPLSAALLESNFSAETWSLREDARHAKGPTESRK